jgi:hypothetical protein
MRAPPTAQGSTYCTRLYLLYEVQPTEHGSNLRYESSTYCTSIKSTVRSPTLRWSLRSGVEMPVYCIPALCIASQSSRCQPARHPGDVDKNMRARANAGSHDISLPGKRCHSGFLAFESSAACAPADPGPGWRAGAGGNIIDPR